MHGDVAGDVHSVVDVERALTGQLSVSPDLGSAPLVRLKAEPALAAAANVDRSRLIGNVGGCLPACSSLPTKLSR